MARVELADRLSDARARVEAESIGDSSRGLPKFARLTRKEARVREDQYAALSALARTLMRRRRVKDERITENTLIRVAIDLLLAHQDQLRGATEDELRRVRDFDTPEVRHCRSHDLCNCPTSRVPEFGTLGLWPSANRQISQRRPRIREPRTVRGCGDDRRVDSAHGRVARRGG